jgi:hypothetical protein
MAHISIWFVVMMLIYSAAQTDRQTGDLISLLSFLESRLKITTR